MLFFNLGGTFLWNSLAMPCLGWSQWSNPSFSISAQIWSLLQPALLVADSRNIGSSLHLGAPCNRWPQSARVLLTFMRRWQMSVIRGDPSDRGRRLSSHPSWLQLLLRPSGLFFLLPSSVSEVLAALPPRPEHSFPLASQDGGGVYSVPD